MELSIDDLSLLQRLSAAMGAQALYDALPPRLRKMLPYVWEINARPTKRLPSGEYAGQEEPPGDWRTWLCLPGRGWGKTRTLNEWVRRKAKKHPGCRIALIGATASEARKIAGSGESGLQTICPAWERPRFSVTDQCYVFPKVGGKWSLVFLYSADKPDLFRGPQFHFVAADEFAKWRRLVECYYNIQFGLRLPVPGGRAQLMIGTTPRPLQTLRDIKAKKSTVTTIGTSFENAANLDPETVEEWMEWKDTAIGQQELLGKLFEEVEGACFQRLWIKQMLQDAVPPLERIGVGVDPAETDTGKDDTGIIVAGSIGRGIKGRGYVLDDRTCHKPPDAAAEEVVRAAIDWHASFVKVDGGRNGKLFASIIKMAAERMGVHLNILPPKGGNLGKRAWASPVAAMYQQGRIYHINRPLLRLPGSSIVLANADMPVLRELEEQMCTWTEERQDQGECGSPDRMDANSYVLTELLMNATATYGGQPDNGPGRRA